MRLAGCLSAIIRMGVLEPGSTNMKESFTLPAEESENLERPLAAMASASGISKEKFEQILFLVPNLPRRRHKKSA